MNISLGNQQEPLISKFEKIFVNGEVVYSQDSEKPYQATLITTTTATVTELLKRKITVIK